jgi:uncharacterized membrane protein
MAVASETVIVGVFNSVQDAQDAVRDLEMEGVSRGDISIVANKNAAGYDTVKTSDKTSDVIADAGIGAAIGGVGGLLLSAAGAITIPVIGPILAAGPIVAALTGAGIGAAAGGLIGALTESGIPEDEAKMYAEGVRRGDVLVTVKSHGQDNDRLCDILDRHGAVDVEDRVSGWKQRGWTGYANDARPFTADELRTERSYYTTDRDRYTTTGDKMAQGFQSTREGAAKMREGTRNLMKDTSSADLDRDGDANMLERGAYKTKEGMKDAGRAVRNAWDDVTDRPRRSRIYDRTS